MSIKKIRVLALATVMVLAMLGFYLGTAGSAAAQAPGDAADGCFVMVLGGKETCQNDQHVCPVPLNRCVPSAFVEIVNGAGDSEFHLFRCDCDLRAPGPRECRVVQGGWPHTQQAHRRDPNTLCVGACTDLTKDCVASVVGNDEQGHAVFECRCE